MDLSNAENNTTVKITKIGCRCCKRCQLHMHGIFEHELLYILSNAYNGTTVRDKTGTITHVPPPLSKIIQVEYFEG